MDTNPFRTGEAEQLHRIGTELGAQSGSTPGTSFTRVTGEQFRNILGRQEETEKEEDT